MIIDLETLASSQLPREVAVSVITMAELAAGPHATSDPEERGRRQDRLQRAEAAKRTARGARAVDLLVAASALGAELPLYTLNGADFEALDDLVEVIVV